MLANTYQSHTRGTLRNKSTEHEYLKHTSQNTKNNITQHIATTQQNMLITKTTNTQHKTQHHDHGVPKTVTLKT